MRLYDLQFSNMLKFFIKKNECTVLCLDPMSLERTIRAINIILRFDKIKLGKFQCIEISPDVVIYLLLTL